MKKFLSIIVPLAVCYVLPLCAKPSLLLNWQILLLAALCAALFATQPAVSIQEAKEKKATDKNSMWLILFISTAGQIISVVEWAYFHAVKQHSNTACIYAGAALLVAGTALRLYAIWVLGKYFTATVQIKQQHKIITRGPYKILRHPSYTGAYISMLGCALFLQSYAGMVIMGLGMLYAYYIRIKVEEAALIKRFRADYELYVKKTWTMFPYVW